MARQSSHAEQKSSGGDMEEIALSLPRDTSLFHTGLTQYQNIWYRTAFIPSIISFQKHFQARNDDIFITSQPKSGTTWLKALVFSIVNRSKYTFENSPVLNTNPHELVPIFEYELYANKDKLPDLDNLPSPRLLSTHMSYDSLPLKNSNCRIVYICRNPLDTIASYWHFASQMNDRFRLDMPIEKYVDFFLQGVSPNGPFWEHILGFWNASLENPDKVLFLKYEDLKQDTVSNLKKLAHFVGFPFSSEEEKDGVIEQIIKVCSLKSLKNLDVNKSGKVTHMSVNNKTFFRKGEVGDYVHHFEPRLVERVQKAMQEKFSGSGLSFEYSNA